MNQAGIDSFLSTCRIGILTIDEKSSNQDATKVAAQRVRDDGIKMIVVGIKVSYVLN